MKYFLLIFLCFFLKMASAVSDSASVGINKYFLLKQIDTTGPAVVFHAGTKKK